MYTNVYYDLPDCGNGSGRKRGEQEHVASLIKGEASGMRIKVVFIDRFAIALTRFNVLWSAFTT